MIEGKNEENQEQLMLLVEKLKKENKHLRLILDMSADLLFVYDIQEDAWGVERVAVQRDTDIEVAGLFTVSTGYARKFIHEDDLDKYDDFVNSMKRGEAFPKGDFRMKEQGHHWFHKDVRGFKIIENGKAYIIGSVKNTSILLGGEIEETDYINKDPLTKLLNKVAATDIISESVLTDNGGALFVLDIDNFKFVNDSHGHLFGDEVLKNVAKSIRNIFRYDDIIGRVGGDEFVIYMRNSTNISEIEKKASQLCKVISGIYVGEEKNFSISASIGIALVPRDGREFNVLFDKADNAMYYSKNNGKNSYTVYDSENKEIITGGRKNKKELSRDYTTFNNKSNKRIDKFAYELADFTFQIMEDTSDMDSAINLLLRKVKEYYMLSEVTIYGVNVDPMTLECIYEVTNDKNNSRLKTIKSYSKTMWNDMIAKFSTGYIEKVLIHDENGKKNNHILVPMYTEKEFIGYVEFVKEKGELSFDESEKNVFKAFVRIISAYAMSTRAYLETNKMVERMNEVDSLTGLYKYEKFHEILRNSLKKILKEKDILLVYSDISHFKVVNEAYGYAVGDGMLKAFADYINSGEKDIICASRVYSDNFISAIMIPKNYPKENLVKWVDGKNDEIGRRLQLSFFDNKITISSGMYIIKSGDEDVETAITNANFARKEAKRMKSRSAVMFNEKMMEEIRKDVRLTSGLPRALENNEICVYYQPKTECGSTNIVGAEALVRWVRADGSMIYPDEFIPIFEKNGSIIELDYFVYEQVFKYIAGRLEKNLFVVPISVNVSRAHLEMAGFSEYINELFEKYNVPPEYIEFELTESIYIKNIEKVLKLNGELRCLGAKVSMDDFGSGYSSLTMLNDLPIDVIKIDKSLMRNNILTESDEIIVGSIVNMAKKLNMKVLCEGVETEEQNIFLSKVGCDIIQGYLFSKPLPEKEFNKYMEEHRYAQAEEIRFAFNGNLKDESGKYEGTMIGNSIEYTDGPVEGMKALLFKGGNPGREVIELSADIYSSKSYSVSMWVYEEEANLWTSVLYTMFECGFASIMPRGWGMKGTFRLKRDDEPDGWCDAGSEVELEKGWNHIAAILDSTGRTSQLFINGSRAGITTNIPDLYLAKKVILGGDIFQPSFKGKISDLRFYNAPISSIKIEEEYKKVKDAMNKEKAE